MHMRRIIVSVAITAFWLVMMGMLVHNQMLRRRPSPEGVDVSLSQLTEKWRDYEEWMKLAVGGKSEGVSFTAIRRKADGGGYVVCNRMWLDLEVARQRHAFRLQTLAALDGQFRLERASAEARLDDAQMNFAALVEGLRLYYRWQFEGRNRVGMQRLEQPVSLLEAVRPMLTRRLELKVGNVYRLPVLDSTWSLKEGKAEVRVEARQRIRIARQNMEAYRLVVQVGPFSSTTWVSPEGDVLRREFSPGIVMERVERQEATARFPGIDAAVEMSNFGLAEFQRPEASGAPGEEIGPLNLLGDLFGKN